MATAVETAGNGKSHPITVFRQTLQTMQPELKMALPAHIPPEKFARVAQTAINNNPDLLGCDRRSLMGAIVRLAQDGLLPDGREAALVKFRTKEKGQYIDKVQAMPMIFGILKKLRQSGEIAKVSAQVIYEHDEFVWRLGFDEDVTHNPPPLDQPRGKAIGAYATAVLKDGSRLLEVMSLEEIERVRSVSKSKDNEYGPWNNWWGEMARKTVMRRLSKRLPMSSDLYEEISRDETAPPIDLQPHQPEPARISRLDAIEAEIIDESSPATGGLEAAEAGGETTAGEVADPAEGPADEQRGEIVTLDSAKAEIDAAETVIDVNARLSALVGNFYEKTADALRSHAMEKIAKLTGQATA